MRSSRSAFVLSTLVLGGAMALSGCTGDDNSLPLPPDSGSDAKASDGAAGDATTSKGDAGKDAAKEESDAALDATTEVDGGGAPADAGDAGEAPDAEADGALDGGSVDAADDGG